MPGVVWPDVPQPHELDTDKLQNAAWMTRRPIQRCAKQSTVEAVLETNATTVFRFMGKVIKMTREPVPHMHVELPKNIERRMVRRQPRALSTLGAALHKPDGPAAVIVDISVSGVRLAVEAATKLEKNAVVPICMTISMLERMFQLTINGRITATFGASDTNFPEIHFYGVQFEDLNETAMLVLHAFVQEQLTQELDRLSRVLAIEAAYEGAPPAAPKKK